MFPVSLNLLTSNRRGKHGARHNGANPQAFLCGVIPSPNPLKGHRGQVLVCNPITLFTTPHPLLSEGKKKSESSAAPCPLLATVQDDPKLTIARSRSNNSIFDAQDHRCRTEPAGFGEQKHPELAGQKRREHLPGHDGHASRVAFRVLSNSFGLGS